MSKVPRKPSFRPPMASGHNIQQKEESSRINEEEMRRKHDMPKPGEKGWLLALVEDKERRDQSEQVVSQEISSEDVADEEYFVDSFAMSTGRMGSDVPKSKEPGWLLAAAESRQRDEQMLVQDRGKKVLPSSSVDETFSERPKPGEKGWLVALAESMEEQTVKNVGMSSSQPSRSCKESHSQQSKEPVSKSQEVGRPKPGEPGWLVAIAESLEVPRINPKSAQSSKGGHSEQSEEPLSVSRSREAARPKPGEPGWLVAIAESLEEPSIKPKPSQDSGKGKSTGGTIPRSQVSKTSTSQVSSSQSSISSAFELLASEEVASQVLAYQQREEGQAKDSQGILESEWSDVDNVGDGENATIDPIAEVMDGSRVTNANDGVSVTEEIVEKASAPRNDQLSSVLDDILTGMRSRAAKAAEPGCNNTGISNLQGRTSAEGSNACDELNQLVSAPEEPNDLASSNPSGMSPSISIFNAAESAELTTSKPTTVVATSSSNVSTSSNIQAAALPTASKSVPNIKARSDDLLMSGSKTSDKVMDRLNKVKSNKVGPVRSKAPKKVPNQANKSRKKPVSTKKIIRGVVERKGEDVKAALFTLQKMRTDCTWVKCTKEDCGKWRYLTEKDPSMVERDWVCKDNPDQRYAECGAPEQWWDKRLKNKFVENRFTVGSLVWARMEGWPAWPAMVDDDPDTGDFFWTEVKDSEWEAKPRQYHVVFFDAKEKEVSRAWISDRRLEKFDGRMELKGTKSSRLLEAIQMAESARMFGLEDRRRKYCLATRFKGPWGPVWPGWGDEQQTDVQQKSDDDIDNIMDVDVSRFNANISLNHEIIEEAVHVAASRKVDELSNTKDGHSEKSAKSSSVEVDDNTLAACSRSSTRSVLDVNMNLDKSPALNKENIPPSVSCAKLYDNRSIYTQELSQTTVSKHFEKQSASFDSDEEDLDNELRLDVESAMEVVNNFTPIKQNLREVPKANSVGANISTPSPMMMSTVTSSKSLLTSTPIVKSKLATSSAKSSGENVSLIAMISPREESHQDKKSAISASPLRTPKRKSLSSPSEKSAISASPLRTPKRKSLSFPSEISTPQRGSVHQTSTPMGRSVLAASPHPNSCLANTPTSSHHPVLPSPITKHVISPGGDFLQPDPALDITSNSTAFSADGSFMDL